jgi:hypothetical protein
VDVVEWFTLVAPRGLDVVDYELKVGGYGRGLDGGEIVCYYL